jgi:hypothetical protein
MTMSATIIMMTTATNVPVHTQVPWLTSLKQASQ